jgi:glutathionylspermidine synthase
MLHYIVFEDDNFEEPNLILNKILCGASPDFFVDTSVSLNEMEKRIGDQLLTAVTKNWEKLDNTSARGLRESFLKRDGIIKKNENNYTLIVEGKPFDMLLKTIPWNIMMIQTSFMDIRLLVEWKI